MSASYDLLILSDFAVRDRGVPLRRFLDAAPLPSGGRVRHLTARWYQNDEELEERHFRKREPAVLRGVRMMVFLLRNLGDLKKARAIYCLDGAHFEGLMLLSRAGMLDVSGKTIRRYSFHNRLVDAIAPRLRKADAAFQIEMITLSQVRSARQTLGQERVAMRPWKIDADWYDYRPHFAQARSFLLCPGNIHRAELMLPALLDHEPSWQLIRASRSPRDISHPRCEVRVNTPHAEYLDLVRHAQCVLLPIEPCDEPAGLTAAMEAIATGTPVLANASLGISELFEECGYPLPFVKDLDPGNWASAVRELHSRLQNPGFKQALDLARKKLVLKRAILPNGADWSHIMHEMADRRAVETTLGPVAEPMGA